MTDETEYPVGFVVGHGTDEDGPADVGLALQLPDGRQLWCGEITRDRWEDAGPEAAELGSDGGWWIILYSKGDTKVIGKCIDQWLAADMLDALGAALRAPAFVA